MHSNVCGGTVKGQWSGKEYTVLRKLGSGSIGDIYLVADDCGQYFAMKTSRDIVSITKEYDNLNRFSDVSFSPKVYELDDYMIDDDVYHYFTMEYIEGYTLRDAMPGDSMSFRNKIGVARLIADEMKVINDRGYVYTDLKFENIMVDKRNGLIRLIDMGSITPIGGMVKEYTPMYDRSRWNAGKRKADLTYQVFTVAILLISMLLNTDINPDKEKLSKVLQRLKMHNFPGDLYEMVEGCLQGSIADCGSLCGRLDAIYSCSYTDKRFTYALDAVIALLSVLMIVMIRTVFA